MSANTSFALTNLDFDTTKMALKSYLQSQDRFKDYDFDGSNLSVLLDILSYNTFHNAFYVNMVANEMFLDSSELRESVLSHAKELNYLPRSFKSAEAKVALTITSTNPDKTSIVIPKGTSFTSEFFDRTFTFVVADNVVINEFTIDGNRTIFSLPELTLYEGVYVSDTYVLTDPSQRFTIRSQNVDISSISITVIEDNIKTVVYNRAFSLFDIDSESKVFFVQTSVSGGYEVFFGDGISGKQPKRNSVVAIEYRVSSGELPNGSAIFIPDSTIDGESNIQIATIAKASGGSVSESIESIKYNAPRHFTAQERAVTTEDYETLMKINFPEVKSVTAFGGEKLDPPQYGKVFVAVDLVDSDGLPDVKRRQFYNFLKPRSPVSIDPVFVEPAYTYIEVVSKVNYNVNLTRLTAEDVKTIVEAAILKYSETNLNDFNRTFRYSSLVSAIDDAQMSIISNQTDIRLVKRIEPRLDTFLTFDVDFGVPLRIVFTPDGSCALRTSEITFEGIKAYIKDDGNGIVGAYSSSNDSIIRPVGTIDYAKGLVQFSNLKIAGIVGNVLSLYATTRDKDLSIINNVIINIDERDLKITAIPSRV